MRISFVVLCATVLATQVTSQTANPCSPSPCGPNTRCEVRDNFAGICHCLPGWTTGRGGDTIKGCTIRAPAEGKPSSRPLPPAPPRRPLPVNVIPDRLSGAHIGVSRNPVRLGGNPCNPDPCGENTSCTSQGDRPVCSCLPNHIGDPYSYCRPDGCLSNPCGRGAECISRGTDYECRCPPGFGGNARVACEQNPCASDLSPCARNARCEARGNQAICTCPEGYEGDPFSECVLNPCLLSPCGVNARCNANRRSRTAQCVCEEGYEGDPYRRCNLNPCYKDPCGPNSRCEASGQSARCTCDEGYIRAVSSDPFGGCVLEPCARATCGRAALCEARGRSALCTCPRGFTGDPHTECRPDPCQENPCGPNALCENVASRSGDAAGHTCTCPPGYVGNAYDSSRGCRFDPCAENPCGPNTDCNVSGDRAVCRCLRGFVGSPESRSGCRADPCSVVDSCGQNAECRNEIDRRSSSGAMRPVCVCPPRHVGNPYDRCIPGDCLGNSECPVNQACKDYRCIDPCLTSCGQGAECEVQNHVAICRCGRGMTGDPFRSCRRFTKEEICEACGANTDCEVGPDDRPICRCKQDFIGNPLTGCRYECQSDSECSASQKCQQFRCAAVCDQDACGENANCSPRNNRAQCTCPEDFLGDPYSRCYTECTRHQDCSSTQACVKFKCVDPCYVPKQTCGDRADCNVRNHKPICSCPRGFTGDPFVSCREFTRDDLCARNPCGANARCQPGIDRRTGTDEPVCTCPPGYRGDPLIECRRGECEHDSECRTHQACYNFLCQDPCLKDVCGVNSDCEARGHTARCTCPPGYVGDPLVACRISRKGSQSRITGFSRFRRAIRINKLT